MPTPLRWLALLLVWAPLPSAHAGAGEAALKAYEDWLDGERSLSLSVKGDTTFSGDSPFRGVTTSRTAESITRGGDEWVIRIAREDFDAAKRKLRPPRVVEFKVTPQGSVTIPRKPDGSVADNVIANEELTSDQFARFLTSESAFVFGFVDSQLAVAAALRRGSITETATQLGGRQVVELRSTSRHGGCALAVDPARDSAPVRFEHRVAEGDIVGGEFTLGSLPASKSSYYLPERQVSTAVVFDVTEWSATRPVRIKAWRRTKTTTYASGKKVVQTIRASATYPDGPATGPAVAVVPPGTPAHVEKAGAGGVEYQWDGERAVPVPDPVHGQPLGRRLRGAAFVNSWAVWVAVAVVALALAAVVFYRLRRSNTGS